MKEVEESFNRNLQVESEEQEDDKYLLDLMLEYQERDISRPDLKIKESGTIDIYIQKLRRNGIPWLKAK